MELFLSYIGEGSFQTIIQRLLPYSVCKIFYGLYYIRGGINIQEKEKIYYNQKNVIDEIHKDTGCSIYEISKILNSLGNMVKDKFSDSNNYVEIKLFPGLKVTSRFIPSEQTVSKRLNIDSEESLFLTASFTDDFRKKIRKQHKNVDRF